jgi:hypothetical protein
MVSDLSLMKVRLLPIPLGKKQTAYNATRRETMAVKRSTRVTCMDNRILLMANEEGTHFFIRFQSAGNKDRYTDYDGYTDYTFAVNGWKQTCEQYLSRK